MHDIILRSDDGIRGISPATNAREISGIGENTLFQILTEMGKSDDCSSQLVLLVEVIIYKKALKINESRLDIIESGRLMVQGDEGQTDAYT